jgi:DNA-binding transcriptional LysR family regulator
MVIFAEVAEQGSFTGAADALGIAKSVVSARISRLEAALGVRLLHRTSRRVTLTPVGAEVLPSCVRVAQAAAEARTVAAGEASAPRGRLRVNAPVSFGQRWLPGPLASFAARHPAVQLEVVLQDDLVDVAAGWDVVIRLGVVRDPELTVRRFARDLTVACASPAYLARRGVPQHPLDLARHDCLRYAYISRDEEWRFTKGEETVTVPVTGTLAATDGALLAALAEAGAGVTVAPWFIVGERVRAGRLVRLLPAWNLNNELPCQLVHAQGRRPPARVRAFVEHLVEAFRTPPWGEP